MTDEKDKIELKTIGDTDWGEFLLTSIMLDKQNNTPNGYHWLLGLFYIDFHAKIFPNIDFINIQKTLPDNHELKRINIPTAIFAKPPNKFPNLFADKLAGHFKSTRQKHVNIISFFRDNFEDSIDFSNFIFPVDVYFEEANFSDSVSFENAIFKNKAIFKNVKFSSYTTFENAQFELYAPSFYGSSLNDEMFWTDIKLPKFEKIDDKETEERYKKRIKDNENAYENLSTKLGNQKKYRDEHFFFRQEMSCQRELAESRTSRFAFRLYELFSDYGYRIGRAFWCWIGHIVFGALFIAFIANTYEGTRYLEGLPCAISVSFANANPYAFFGFDSENLKECYQNFNRIAPILFALIKAVQTILGIALLFLVVLTLRVRFRLK